MCGEPPANKLSEVPPDGIVDDDGAAVGKGLDRMAGIARNNRNHTGPGNPDLALNGHFQLALDYFVDFFLRMGVFVNGRAALEVVVGKGHAGRVEIASIP